MRGKWFVKIFVGLIGSRDLSLIKGSEVSRPRKVLRDGRPRYLAISKVPSCCPRCGTSDELECLDFAYVGLSCYPRCGTSDELESIQRLLILAPAAVRGVGPRISSLGVSSLVGIEDLRGKRSWGPWKLFTS